MINKLHSENNDISTAQDTLRAKLALIEPTPVRLAAEHAAAQAKVVAKYTEALAMQAMEHAEALAGLMEQAAEIAGLATEQAAALDPAEALVSNESAALAKITAEIEELSSTRAVVLARLTSELVAVQTGLIQIYLEYKYLRMNVRDQVDSIGRLNRRE